MHTTTRNVLAALFVLVAGSAVAQPSNTSTQNSSNSNNTPNTNTTTNNNNNNNNNNAAFSPSDPSQTALVELGQFGMPNDNHFRFGLDTMGRWTTVTTWWPAPDAQPMTTTGEATFTLVDGMGGKFVRQEFRNTDQNQKFVGNAIYGFNNATNQYESVWFDSAASHMIVSHGVRADDGSISFTGAFVDPRDGLRKTTRTVLSWQGKTTMTSESFDTTSDGREFRNLRVVYTRTTPHTWNPNATNTSTTATTTNNNSPNTTPRRFTNVTPGSNTITKKPDTSNQHTNVPDTTNTNPTDMTSPR
ncbi:MAG: DUF1579 family protein [Planctomycetota bacterium]|nr:DUF1579 family protein [Planctomycetota bacterium]